MHIFLFFWAYSGLIVCSIGSFVYELCALRELPWVELIMFHSAIYCCDTLVLGWKLACRTSIGTLSRKEILNDVFVKRTWAGLLGSRSRVATPWMQKLSVTSCLQIMSNLRFEDDWLRLNLEDSGDTGKDLEAGRLCSSCVWPPRSLPKPVNTWLWGQLKKSVGNQNELANLAHCCLQFSMFLDETCPSVDRDDEGHLLDLRMLL